MFSPGGGGHVSIHWEMRVLKVTSLRKVSYWRNVDAIEWRWYRAMLKLTRGGFVLVDMFQSYGSLGGYVSIHWEMWFIASRFTWEGWMFW